jgi:hypothetical protein
MTDNPFRTIIYTGNGGYPSEIERANKVFTKGQQYKVTGGWMSSSYTALEIEGVPGKWNSALFKCNIHKMDLPSSFMVAHNDDV